MHIIFDSFFYVYQSKVKQNYPAVHQIFLFVIVFLEQTMESFRMRERVLPGLFVKHPNAA